MQKATETDIQYAGLSSFVSLPVRYSLEHMLVHMNVIRT